MFKYIILMLIATFSYADDNLAKKYACSTCHKVDKKTVGPALKDIAIKYKNVSNSEEQISSVIRNGSKGVWGKIPMPPNPTISNSDVQILTNWILSK